MELITEELKLLRKEIAQSKQPQNTFFELPEGIHLPLKSIEEIDSMEKSLVDKRVMDVLVRHFILI